MSYQGRKEKVVLRPILGPTVLDSIWDTRLGGVCGTTRVPGSPHSPETTCLIPTPPNLLEIWGLETSVQWCFSLELIFLSRSLSQLVLSIWFKLSGFEKEEAGES